MELDKEGEEEEGETLIRRVGRKDVWDLTLVCYPPPPPPLNGDRVQDEDCQMFIHAEVVIYGARLHPPVQSSRACIHGINKPASSALFSNDVPADALGSEELRRPRTPQ